MLENGVFNRPYVRDITKICECACSMNCDKNATELRPDRNPDIITNADRIRAMSDEELVVFLDGFTCNCIDCRDNDGRNEICPIYKRQYGRYCEPKDIMGWLQSPAEEDT